VPQSQGGKLIAATDEDGVDGNHEAANSQLGCGSIGCSKIGLSLGMQYIKMQPKGCGAAVCVSRIMGDHALLSGFSI
jgi:hypothetical protein